MSIRLFVKVLSEDGDAWPRSSTLVLGHRFPVLDPPCALWEPQTSFISWKPVCLSVRGGYLCNHFTECIQFGLWHTSWCMEEPSVTRVGTRCAVVNLSCYKECPWYHHPISCIISLPQGVRSLVNLLVNSPFLIHYLKISAQASFTECSVLVCVYVCC